MATATVEETKIPEKMFYRINEASRITGLKPYVLRYWETEFKQLKPEKDMGDQRRYRQKDIDLILEIKHLLSVLYHEVGIDAIKEKVVRPFQELKIATHYGCHALRPSEVVQFDDPVNPTLFDALVEATGAESIDWQARLDCCGAPLFGVNDDLSMDLMEKKVTNARESGAEYLCVGCPYCHIQFDTVQTMLHRERSGNHLLPPILYPQLLGLSLGIESHVLGLEMNRIEIAGIERHLSA